MNEEKLTNAIMIMDMVGSLLLELFKIVQARRASIKAVEMAGGLITEADWEASSLEFNRAFDSLIAELDKE